ncbi:MAG TPA: PadR family transcriptional regulator [Streptosporangiaceae bacterium]|jgi:DNA-binding PadR family transcriptional regulator
MSRSLTPLALALLHMLSDGPMHPYEMRQRIRDHGIDYAIKVTHGALYHAVERLAERGFIEAVETSRAGRRPERTVYAITEAGRDEALSQLRGMIARPVEEYPTLSAALAFARMLPPEELAHLLLRRTVAVEAKIAAHDTIIDGLHKQGVDRIGLIEVEYIQALQRAELDWLRAAVEEIESGRLQWQQTGRET